MSTLHFFGYCALHTVECFVGQKHTETIMQMYTNTAVCNGPMTKGYSAENDLILQKKKKEAFFLFQLS